LDRHDLKELHFITLIENVPSIVQHGILSHRRAARLSHASIAMPEIQNRRKRVVVPGARPLHEYANLYICARNPMLYKRQSQHRDLCVLCVSTSVLELDGVIVTDGNAASSYTRFAPAPQGLAIVNRDWTFAEFWTDADQIQKWRKAAAKCAEVLVPDIVHPRYLTGAYVSCQEAIAKFDSLKTGLPASIDSRLFFL
jgi:hypothetical protein